MAKASLTIQIGGEYNSKAIQQAQKDLENLRLEAAKNVDGVSSSLVDAGSAMQQAGSKMQQAGSKMQSVGNSASKYLTVPLAAAGAASVAAAIEIDDSLTGVRKTVDGTEEDYQRLKDAAIEFSKTNAVSPSQILDIQALGAQLGFGIDELDEFGRVVSGLDIATNMDAETAATELAHFANITKMSHGDISNYGSAIVDLGNNYATTEADISAMAMRLAAAGTQAGMSQADILGLATALTSMGVEAEAGGTAISTIMSRIDKAVASNSDEIEVWASTAGMSAEQFAEIWRKNPVEALTELLTNMESTTEEGGNMSLMLEDLGISSVRQTDIMKRLAGNSELVGSAVATANEAWKENSALQEEVDNRNESLSARFEMLRNRLVAVGDSIGGPLAEALLDAVDAAEPLFQAIADGAQAFADMDEQQQQVVLGVAGMAAAFGPVVSVVGKFTSGVGSFVKKGGEFVKKIGVMTSGVEDLSVEELKAKTGADKAKDAIGKLSGTADSAASNTKKLGDNTGVANTNVGELASSSEKAATQTKTLGENASAAAGNTKSLADNAVTANTNMGELASNSEQAATKTLELSDHAGTAAANTRDLGSAAGEAIANTQGLASETERASTHSGNLAGNIENAATNTEHFGTVAGNSNPSVAELANATEGISASSGTAAENIQSMAANAEGAVANTTALGDAAADAKDGVSGTATATKELGDNASAASEGTGKLKGGLELLDGICKTAAIGLAVGLIGDLVGQFQAYYEHEQLVEEATTGLTSSIGAVKDAYDTAAGSFDSNTEKLATIASTADDCLQKQAELAQTTRETWSEIGTDAAELDYYAGIIDNLRDKTGLTANEQERLKLAVENFNSITGENLQVIDQQNGKLSESKEKIDQVTEAWKQQSVITAVKDLYSESLKQMIEDEKSLDQAQKELSEASEGWGIWIGDFPLIADPASVAYHDLKKKVDDLTAAHKAANEQVKYYEDLLAQGQTVFANFDDALESSGTKMEDFGDLTEEQLDTLKTEFDGTLDSIVDSCNTHGVKVPQSLADAIKNNKGVAVTEAVGLSHDVMDGVDKGINDKMSMLESNMTKLGGQFMPQWMRTALQSHSPSKVFEEIGGDAPAGLALGVDRNTGVVETAVMGLGEDMTAAASTIPAQAAQIGAEYTGNLAAGMASTVDIENAADRLNAMVTEALSSLPQDGSAIGRDTATNLVAAINACEDQAAQAAELYKQAVENGLIPLGEDGTAIGTETGENLAAALRNYEETARSASESLKQAASLPISDLPETGSSVSRDFVSNIVHNFDESKASVHSASEELSASAASGMDGLPDDAEETGTDSGKGLSEGLEQQTEMVQNATKMLQATAKDALLSLTKDFKAIALDAVKELKDGIRGSSARDEGQKLAKTAEDGLFSVRADNAGFNFVQGFINNLVSGGTNVFNAAWNLGISALNGIMGALGEASPSKKSYRVGEFFVQGGVNAIRHDTRDLTAAAADAGTATSSAFEDALSGTHLPSAGIRDISLSGASPYNDAPKWHDLERSRADSRQFVFNVNVNVTAGSVETAKAVGKTLGEQLYEEVQRRERSLI